MILDLKDYKAAKESLKNISELKENWNENGASTFSKQLIKKCYKLLDQLVVEPFVSPTAYGAIQFEYEKENSAYLEFEIYEDRIEVFSISSAGEEDEKTFNGADEFYQVKQMVIDFYERLEENKMKAMISQPMGGKTEEEILKTKQKTVAALEEMGYEVLNTYFEEKDEDLKAKGFGNVPLYHLAKSLKAMAKCDAVYFCEGWENKRGCRIEHETAKKYGLNIIYEQEN